MQPPIVLTATPKVPPSWEERAREGGDGKVSITSDVSDPQYGFQILPASRTKPKIATTGTLILNMTVAGKRIPQKTPNSPKSQLQEL